MMRKQILCACLVSFLAGPALAEAVPGRGAHDSRVRVTRHVDGQVYLINTSLTRATTVEFEEGERIVSIVAGDTEAFKFQSVPGDRVFAIKPTARGVNTNVTVYTDRRSYYFSLQEASNAFYVVRFDYPKRASQSAGNQPRRTAQNANYGVSASSEITPVAIWDDGSFTYFQFRPNAPVPAIFKVTNGMERSVNSQVVQDRVVRVSGTSRQWALRLGEQEICVAELFS